MLKSLKLLLITICRYTGAFFSPTTLWRAQLPRRNAVPRLGANNFATSGTNFLSSGCLRDSYGVRDNVCMCVVKKSGEIFFRSPFDHGQKKIKAWKTLRSIFSRYVNHRTHHLAATGCSYFLRCGTFPSRMGRPATTAYVDRFICLTEQTLAAASGLSVSRARRLCDALSEEKLDYNLPKKKEQRTPRKHTLPPHQ